VTEVDVDVPGPAAGAVVLSVPPALARLVSGWLAEYRSPETVRAYRRELATWLAWYEQVDLDPLQARRGDVATYAREVLDAPRVLVARASGRTRVIKPSGATVARAMAALSSFYAYAHDTEAVGRNPVTGRRPKLSRQGKTPGMSLDQARALLKVANTWPHGPRGRAAAFVHLMTATAIRVGEALGADVDDLGHRRALRRRGPGPGRPLRRARRCWRRRRAHAGPSRPRTG
jgi:site-specific recombinase XerD